MSAIPKILLLIESSRTCERDFLRGIAHYAHLHSPWAFFQKPKFYLRSKQSTISISQIKDFNPDGIIVSDTEDLDQIRKLNKPTIIHTFKKNAYPLPCVLGDVEETGRMGAEYLLGLGYKHFAYCGIGDYYWSLGRYDSFQKTIQQAGFSASYFKLNPKRIKCAHAKELQNLADWLIRLPKPLGLMTCADDCSQHIMEACKLSDIHVPEQVGVLGVDNDDMICDLSNPPLSSIALNFKTAGYQTAELLNDLMSGTRANDRSVIVRPSHIEMRASTDIFAVEDTDVASALKYIRENSNKLIQVADVVNAVTCSQRTLHNKFLKMIGHSVHAEIKKARVERIAKMLRETDLSVSQIAHKLGYFNTNHVSRYFYQQKGIKPLAYRKKAGKTVHSP